jgi:Txe/YoeB family toxin of toxin-antitoxin system
MYKIVYTKRADKDKVKLKNSKLDKKTKALIEVVRENPFQTPPSYEKLKGDLEGAFSRRINIQHRLVYEVLECSDSEMDDKENNYLGIVKILKMWTHYE